MTSTIARTSANGTRGPRAQPRRSVLIISGSVGAGHDGAARELASRLRAAGLDVDVRDHLAALPRPFRFLLRDGYTLSVGRVPALFEWLFMAIENRASVRALLAAFCGRARKDVLRWAAEKPYAAIVSTYPLASQTLGDLRASGRLHVPVISYLTDPAVHRSWVHAAVDHHWTVTAATAAQGSADYGVPLRAVGPLVPARFAAAPDDASCGLAVRRELGLDPAQRVALIVAGSLGLGDVEDSAAAVAAAGLVPMVLCGRNASLLERVSALPGVLALGWRDDVHELMRAADVLVHNAGGLSFTEALVAGLPAVSYRCIPGHGLANATVLEGAGLAAWARTDDELADALEAAAARGRTPVEHDDPAEHLIALVSAPARPLVLVPSGTAVRSRTGRAGARAARAVPTQGGWDRTTRDGAGRPGSRRRPSSISA